MAIVTFINKTMCKLDLNDLGVRTYIIIDSFFQEICIVSKKIDKIYCENVFAEKEIYFRTDSNIFEASPGIVDMPFKINALKPKCN